MMQSADVAFLGRFMLQDWSITIPDFYRDVVRIVQSEGIESRARLGQLLQVDLSVNLADPTSCLDGYPWDLSAKDKDRVGYTAIMESFKQHRMVCLNTITMSLSPIVW
jgi:hypothetical protein